MRLKKVLLTLAICSTAGFGLAQDEEGKVNEVGVSFRNLDDFGFTYRFGDTRAVWRTSVFMLEGGSGYSDRFSQYENFNKSSENAFGFGFSFGNEHREAITEKLDLRLGADVNYSYQSYKMEYNQGDDMIVGMNQINTISYGFNMVFGFNYLASSNFVFGVEMLPNLTYTKSFDNEVVDIGTEHSNITTETDWFSYGLRTSGVRMSMVYRF